jgi:hypothetical protein
MVEPPEATLRVRHGGSGSPLTVEDALALQRPVPPEMIKIVARAFNKEDQCQVCRVRICANS